MEKFFCIKLIKKDGTRGYVTECEPPAPFVISINGVASNVMKFNTFTDANTFIKRHKIQNNQVKAYIRDNEDLMKDEQGSGISFLGEKEMWYVENAEGQKLFYTKKEDGYYFSSEKLGFCVWDNYVLLQMFIKEQRFDERVIIKKLKK